MGTLMLLLAMALSFLNLMMSVSGQCNFAQNIELGKQYYIYNEEYPEYYKKGTNCRWSATSEPGTQIVLTCETINIPESNECYFDKLSVSLSGNPTFADAHNYCGKGTLSLVSDSNSMEIGLFSSYWSPYMKTGNFICSIASIQGDVPTTTTKRPVTCDCGWKQGMRIVGGHETGVNEYPFMSALVDAGLGSLYCGASIISERYAVTAAHCLTNRMINMTGLLVGEHNISTGTDTPYSRIYLLNKFIIHPEFEPQTQNNDIALVKTKFNIEFSLYVGPVCLPFRYSSNDFRGLPVTALGWGSEEFSGPRSDVLQEVTLNVISNAQCANTEKDISYQQLCTYAPNKDSCQSDSGGPLVWMMSSIRRLQLVGVISFGLGCATLRPSVNVRVTSYLSWIVSSSPGALLRLLAMVLTFLYMLMTVSALKTKREAKCDCGWKQGMRIVGGQETGVNEYPFMSALVDVKQVKVFCGASIISERYALTAAHCFQFKTPDDKSVLLVGDHKLSTGADTPYAKIYELEEVITHPDHNNKTQQNDIALVKTEKNIEFSVYVGPVCLPFNFIKNDFAEALVTVLGWGKIMNDGPNSDVLKEVTVEVLEHESCDRFFNKIKHNQICAFAYKEDSCQNDSGGPLVWWNNSTRRMYLVGIISYGGSCGGPYPSVNTRVTSYLSWIESNTPGTSYCRR